MKRLVAAVAILSLLTTLLGCGKEEPTQTNPTEYVPIQREMYAISLPAATYQDHGNDNVLLYDYTYQSIAFTHPDPDVAAQIVSDFQDRVGRTRESAEAIHVAAKSTYSGSNGWIPYFYHVLYNPTRIDHSVLSLYGTAVSYNGTMHPEHNCVSANYNMLTGEVLTLGSILSGDVQELIRLLLAELSKIAEEKYLYENYVATVSDLFKGDLSRNESFYFTDTGLCFYFAPYEIAGYASGIITAEIPYSSLLGILSDSYFPPERDASGGILKIETFDLSSADRFTQMAEVVTDETAHMYAIYCDTAVDNVKITVIPGNDSDLQYTLFASEALTIGDAIIIQVPQALLMQLVITCESGGEVLSYRFS